MSVNTTSAEVEESASTQSGRSTVTVRRATRVRFVVIRHLQTWGMTHRYSINT